MAKRKEIMHRKMRKIENLYFEGSKALHAVEVVTFYEYHNKPDENGKLVFQNREIIKIEKNVLDFPLRKIIKKEVIDIRKTKIPSLVLKKDGSLYYTELPKGGLLFSIENLPSFKHLCGGCGHLFALPENKGGCNKVYYNAHIENLNFIKYGFEAFNSGRKDAFIVIDCDNYSTYRLPKCNLNVDEINTLKLALAMELWEDVKSFADIELWRAYEIQKKKELDAQKETKKINKKD